MACSRREAWTRASSASMPARTENNGAWPASQAPKAVVAVLPKRGNGGSGTIFVMVELLSAMELSPTATKQIG